METGTTKYGNYYWCVKTNLSSDGEIFLMADRAEVTVDGSLAFWSERTGEKKSFINLALASGNWTAFYAASLIDGGAVAVEHWANEEDSNIDEPILIQGKIIRLIQRKGPRTVRELAQSIRDLNTSQAKMFVAAMCERNVLSEAVVGRAVRYSVAEYPHD